MRGGPRGGLHPGRNLILRRRVPHVLIAPRRQSRGGDVMVWRAAAAADALHARRLMIGPRGRAGAPVV